jgi:two-component system sensor histidine kinase/response regulator
MKRETNRRILLVDDTEAIHGDFRKILGGHIDESDPADGFQDARSAFFGEAAKPDQEDQSFELVSARQGQEALELVMRTSGEGRPFALAFVDVRMPPGWDGLETIEQLWRHDPDLQVVICTAYSDFSWDQIFTRLGRTDRLLILKKPFDAIEVTQLAHALTEKWNAVELARTQMLELEESGRRAEAASRAKSDFLANMSHEIRTPMTAILGHAEILGESDLSGEKRNDHLEVIKSSGRHLLNVLNDILDLTKVEAGQLSIRIERFDAVALARDVVQLMRGHARQKGIEVVLHVEGSVPASIRSDPVRMRQILLNLTGNAIKFTQEGSVEVIVRAPNSENEILEVEVHDTGMGIPREHLENLFDAFHQVDTTASRIRGGTGIGLTISQQLAHLLGGDITVRSEEGVGSRFVMRVRTGSLQDVEWFGANESRLAPRPPATEGELPMVPGRVLLAEDMPVNQKLVSTYLEKAGMTVSIAKDGVEARDQALAAVSEGSPFDMILMDMQMPILDGYEATRELRKAGYGGPIVALTAHAMAGDKEKCLEAGCDDYTVKPVNRRHLLELCASLIQPRGALPADRPASEPAPEPAPESASGETLRANPDHGDAA